MPARAQLLPAVAAALTAAACGGDGAAADPLTVYAAASLREALPALDPRVRHSFGGSGQLRLQIERGAPADVFVGASERDARVLFAAGRCSRPRTFASNRLVVLVPRGDPARIGSARRLAGRRGLRLAVGAPGVPVGAYAREALRRLRPDGLLRRNRVSAEASVAGITAKVATGSADAGIAYATDARAAAGRVEALELPRWAQPRIRYAACVVRRSGADERPAARYLERLAGAEGRALLRRHGFGAP